MIARIGPRLSRSIRRIQYGDCNASCWCGGRPRCPQNAAIPALREIPETRSSRFVFRRRGAPLLVFQTRNAFRLVVDFHLGSILSKNLTGKDANVGTTSCIRLEAPRHIFVSTNIRQLFDQFSVKTVDSNGEVIIKGEVKKFLRARRIHL